MSEVKGYEIEHQTGRTRTVTVAEYENLKKTQSGWKIVKRLTEMPAAKTVAEKPVAPQGKPLKTTFSGDSQE